MADLTHIGNIVAGRAALEVKAKEAGLSHSPANEPKGSQSRMSGNEVEHWANKTGGGGPGVTRGAPSMHDGGVVEHDGLHNLQKGEVVIPKHEVEHHMNSGSKNVKKHHDFSHTVIEHHDDKTHTVHHIHKKHGFQGPTKGDGDVKGAAGSHDEMMDHVMDHTSAPNPGEDKDVANQPLPGAGAPPPAVPGGPAGV